MPSLVLSPRLTSDSLYLETAAEKLGWHVHRAHRYRVPAGLHNPIVYGDLVFCDIMAEQLGLGLLEPSNTWLAELPEKYLRRKVRAMHHGDLPEVQGRHFIKPANDKVFEAGIFEQGSYVPHRHVDPRLPVYVSEVVSFYAEMRCYVLDRKVLTAALYLGNIDEQEERELYDLGYEWATVFLMDESIAVPSAFVLDIGFIAADEGVESGWAALEVNQAYCSGVYVGGYVATEPHSGADPGQVLRVVERSGGPRSLVRPEDERWLRPREWEWRLRPGSER